jgi:hypothetical protein
MASDQPWVYDPNATGSAQQSAMQGGGGVGSWILNVGGMSGTSAGLLTCEKGADGKISRKIDPRTACSSLLSAGAAAASGAATFSAAAGPGGAIAGVVLGAVAGAVSGGLQAWDSQKVIAKLHGALERAENPHAAIDKSERPKLCEAISYCIGKQTHKRNKGIANAAVVGQPLTTLYRGGKGVYKWVKGTKGVHREEYATYLMDKSKEKSVAGNIARDVVEAIIAMNYDEIAKNALKEDAMKST